jgi:hypothetical protein
MFLPLPATRPTKIAPLASSATTNFICTPAKRERYNSKFSNENLTLKNTFLRSENSKFTRMRALIPTFQRTTY